MKALLRRFVREEKGLETVEYAVMTALIVAAVVLAVTALGGRVADRFNWITTQIPTP